MAERVPYNPPAEGLAVIFRYENDVAIVRHAENFEKRIKFGDKDLPRETRERKGEYFEPLTRTIARTLKEELGIENWKEKDIRITSYSKLDCIRPDGSDIKAHIVIVQSRQPLHDISDPNNIDRTEIIGAQMVPLLDVLEDQTDEWRHGPDGRDLLRAVLPPHIQHPIEVINEQTLLLASD